MHLLAVAVALCLAPSVFAAPSLSDSSLVVSNYLAASNPTAIRFTGANEGFLTEQGGAVKRFAAGALSTVLTVPVATDNAERGLLGLAVDPGFASNRFVYIYHTAATAGGTWIENRLTRYTWNGTSLGSALPLGTFGSATDGQDDGPNHNGGPLVFGPDGKLYGVTGDLNRNGLEQNQSTTQSAFTGGIYRLNSDGTIPADNPFQSNSNGDLRRWHAYGVRNSFGIAFDPVTGALWDTENGPGSYDEINRVPAGLNSGWRPLMGPDSRDPQNAPGDLIMLDGAVYQDPKFAFANPIGITALQFLHGSSWGDGYADALIFGEANSPNLWLLRLNAARDAFVLGGGLADGVFDPGDTFTPFGTGFSIITDIQIGPDSAVYVSALGADAIYRIAPIPEPQTWALSLAGLVLVAGAAQRRRTRPR